MIRKGHVLITKEQQKWRSTTHDTRRNVWKGEGRGVAKQQMLLNLHQSYTQLRERYAAEHELQIAKQRSRLEQRGYRLKKGWEEDQSGPESEGEDSSEASDSGTSDYHIQYHDGAPGVRLEDIAGPSSYMEQLLGSGEDQPEGLAGPTATPTASLGSLPPAWPAVEQSAAVSTPAVAVEGQAPSGLGGLADPGPIPSESDDRLLDSDLRLVMSGSAGGNISWGPGGKPIRLPQSRPAMSAPSEPGPASVRPRLDTEGWTGPATRLTVRGRPVPPRLHLEATLHTSLWVRNYVRQHQGEAEANRQFAYLDDYLARFTEVGFRVESETIVPGREGSVDRPQGSGPENRGPPSGETQGRGRGPAELLV